MPRKPWEERAEITPSTASCTLPPVPFLKPTGMLSPLAIWRCVWLSAVLAPIAAHDTRSAKY